MHILIFKESKYKIILFSLLFISVFFEVMGIGLIYPFIILFFDLTQSDVPVLNLIYDNLNNLNITISKTNILILIVIFFILNSILLLIYRFLISLNGYNFMNSLRERIYYNSFESRYNESSKKVSKIYNSITNQSLESGNAMMLQFQVIESFLGLIILLILSLFISIELTIISALIGIIFFFFLSFSLSLSKRYGRERNKYNENLFKNLNIAFLNIRYLKAINSYDNVYLKIKPLLNKLLFVHLKFTMLSKGTKILNEPLVLICLTIVLFISFKYLYVDAAILVLVFALLRRLYSKIISTISSLQGYNKDLVSVKYCYEIINELKNKKETNSQISFDKLKKSIFFKNINYNFVDTNLFNNTSFKIDKNSTTLIYGKSGSGKSTIINLLLGLLDINKGDLIYDDMNIKNLNKFTIRDNTGFLSQEPVIFNMSIRENLKIRDHKINDDKIIKYLKEFSLNSLFENEIINLDYLVDEKSTNLSGGEKQRLAFIREVIFDPKILVLDEPTSSLDNESRDFIFKYLNKIKHKTTILIVSHDKEFIDFSDNVYELTTKNLNKIK